MVERASRIRPWRRRSSQHCTRRCACVYSRSQTMRRYFLLPIAAVLLAASPAISDEAADLAAIRAQLKVMQHDYDSKIHSLEVRLAKAEADVKAARVATAKQARPVAVSSSATPAQTADEPTTQTATGTLDAAPQDAAVADNAPPPPPA